MNDSLLANIQETIAKLNSAEIHLNTVCKDCKAKERCNRVIQRCGISQARMRMVTASRLLSEVIDRRKESTDETE